MRYHYILTLRAIRSEKDPAVSYSHASGSWTPSPGETRRGIFEKLLGQETEKLAAMGFGIPPRKPVVMFFALEPDELETSDD